MGTSIQEIINAALVGKEIVNWRHADSYGCKGGIITYVDIHDSTSIHICYKVKGENYNAGFYIDINEPLELK